MTLKDEMAVLAESVEGEEDEEKIDSPIRSNAGNVRAVKQMGDEKLWGVWMDMQDFEDADPVGFSKVEDEVMRRGFRRALNVTIASDVAG